MAPHMKQGERDRQAVGGEDGLLDFVMDSPADVIFLNDIIASSRSNWNRRGASCDSFIITSFAALTFVINALYVGYF